MTMLTNLSQELCSDNQRSQAIVHPAWSKIPWAARMLEFCMTDALK